MSTSLPLREPEKMQTMVLGSLESFSMARVTSGCRLVSDLSCPKWRLGCVGASTELVRAAGGAEGCTGVLRGFGIAHAMQHCPGRRACRMPEAVVVFSGWGASIGILGVVH